MLLITSIINGILLLYLISTVISINKKNKEFSKEELITWRTTVLGDLDYIKKNIHKTKNDIISFKEYTIKEFDILERLLHKKIG